MTTGAGVEKPETTFDRVPRGSLIAVVKLVAVGIAGQAHGSLRGRHF
jgi:hypothetical protein